LQPLGTRQPRTRGLGPPKARGSIHHTLGEGAHAPRDLPARDKLVNPFLIFIM